MTPRPKVEQPRDTIPAYSRGYRQVSMKETEREELARAAKAEGFGKSISAYIMYVHRQYQAKKSTQQ